MVRRTANYTAFYVAEPFYEQNLGANAAPDFLSPSGMIYAFQEKIGYEKVSQLIYSL